jgi:hypothetical protein
MLADDLRYWARHARVANMEAGKSPMRRSRQELGTASAPDGV